MNDGILDSPEPPADGPSVFPQQWNGSTILRFSLNAAHHADALKQLDAILDGYLPDATWAVDMDVSAIMIRNARGYTTVSAGYDVSVVATLVGLESA